MKAAGAGRFGAAGRRVNWVAACALVAAAAVGGLAMVGAAPPAQAQEAEAPRADGLIRSHQMDRGALLFRTDEPGLFVPAPLLKTDYDIEIAGPIARVQVTQRFRNTASVFVEGRYVFPLPEGAAVDTLRMRVDDRLIEGEIKEREEAQQIYEQAREEGYVASLVEQERPNVFTTSVANIAPGAVVVIQLEYQERLTPRNGVFGMRLPLVVAPRYSPEGTAVQTVRFGPDGWTTVMETGSDPTPDRDRITPPVDDPREASDEEIRNPVTITIDLEAGFPLGPIQSFYRDHPIRITPRGVDAATIVLDGPAPADRDFYLSWRPQQLDEPYAAIFTEPAGDDRHFVLMITPPSLDTLKENRRPREVIFVLDVSGSMLGESIEQAKAALVMALERLEPGDSFNLIVFNNNHALFAPTPVPATEANIARAVEAVRALEADGGTEMLPALRSALDDGSPDSEQVRQVIFLTDGAVGNEAQMLELINTSLGRSRLFTVGIGSAPNSYFMTAAAEAGRGTHVFIGQLSDVQAEMEALFEKIETPAMTDIAVQIDGFTATEIWPQPIPDLYAGDPVVAAIRVDETTPTRAIPAVRLGGDRAGERWETRIALSNVEERAGVSKLWARQRIRSLEARRLSPEMTPELRDAIDAEILKTALDHHLVSRLTSLVAVDVTPTRPGDEPLTATEVALNLPAGWDADAFFGDTEETDGTIKEAAIQRLTVAAEARRAQAADSERLGVPVPQGSTDWTLRALIGLALMLIGLGALLWDRRRRRPA